MVILGVTVFALNGRIEVFVGLLEIFLLLVDVASVEVVVSIGIVVGNRLVVLVHGQLELLQVVVGKT